MKKIVLLLLLIPTILQAQTAEKEVPDFIEQHPYLKSIYLPDTNAQARLFSASWQYKYSVKYESFRTGGMQATFGINIARFFSNQFVLGFALDIKAVKGFTQQHLSYAFIEDFNTAFQNNYGTTIDSASGYIVNDAFNDVPPHQFLGNYSGSYGIQFSPFPQKYGGILIAAKRGYNSFPIFGTYENEYISNGELDNALFDIKGNYSFELIMKPYTFFHNGYVNLQDRQKNNILKCISIGFYYDKINLENATFNDRDFKKMVNDDFIKKYGIDDCYGMKLGVSLY